ncbi:TetR/AcrR family transcriptional regulator [Acidimangrovimonas pyrenivorans]|uniref:TetR/AcrR family transcriptional regulator n=1 Tax=Acidimangrovimonas pyrenivorans TaxID=2030798 RepID=A0ABV7AM60_9RHOB
MSTKARSDARCRILRAAEAIVRSLGARHLTLDSAAQGAGVSKGGVLYHFPGKQALLEGMIARGVADLVGRIERYRAELAGAPNPTLRAMLRAGREILSSEIDLRSGMIAAVAESPELLAPVRVMLADNWENVRHEAADPADAYLIWSAMEGMLFFASFDVSPLAPDERLACYDRICARAEALPGRSPVHAE